MLPFLFIYPLWAANVLRALVAGERESMYLYQLATYALMAVHVSAARPPPPATALAQKPHRRALAQSCCPGCMCHS